VQAGGDPQSSGIWTINGTGNTFDASDNIGFVSQSLSGNAVIVAKLNSMSANAQGMRSGIMLRASNSPTADYFQFFYDSGFGVISVFEQNSTTGDSPFGTISSSIPIWLRFKKDGTNITAWYSQSANPAWNNDADWTQYGAGFTSSAFNSGFLMGLVVYNNGYGSNSLSNQTQFSNVSTYNF
jgi:transcription elongation factor